MNQHVTIPDQHVCPLCGTRKNPEVAGLTLDALACTVSHKGKRIHIVRQQALLLKCLLDAHPMPVDRNSLFRMIWGDIARSDAIVRVIASQLRRTLQDAGFPVTIKARKSVGYWLEPV